MVVSAHLPQSYRNWLQFSMAPMGISQCGLGRVSRGGAPQPPPALGQVSLEPWESPVPDSGDWRSSLQSWRLLVSAGACCWKSTEGFKLVENTSDASEPAEGKGWTKLSRTEMWE